MKRNNADAAVISRRVGEFLDDYAPGFLTRSEHTLKAYRDALTMYFLFLQDNGVEPESLSREHLERPWIERWVTWLKEERGNSPDTCNNRLASLRRFLEYLGSRDVGMAYLHVESKFIKRQKPACTKVEGMSRTAVEAILAEPDTTCATGRRDLAFLMLLYQTAARIDEVRSLTVGRVHLDAPRPYVTVTGKGSQTRTAYLLPRTVEIVRAYMRGALGPDPDPGSLLFPSRVTGGKLSEVAINKRIKKYAARARRICDDVPPEAHAHQFRHAKATHWIEDKMNVIEVQHMLGHKNLETTLRYLDISMSSKGDALATLESEKDKGAARKWKSADGTLLGFCGLSRRP